MFLIDTNVISEARKGARTNPGVLRFFETCEAQSTPLYLSAITVGELRRGVSLIAHRGDAPQAQRLERWLTALIEQFRHHILDLDADAAQVWGHLRVPNPENELDKQIAAIAMVHGLTVVTRNVANFQGCPVEILNPFE